MLEDPMADIAPAPFLSSRPPAAPGDRAVEACVLVSRAVEARVLGAFGSGQVRSPPRSSRVGLGLVAVAELDSCADLARESVPTQTQSRPSGSDSTVHTAPRPIYLLHTSRDSWLPRESTTKATHKATRAAAGSPWRTDRRHRRCRSS
jgi:hypothetical protein